MVNIYICFALVRFAPQVCAYSEPASIHTQRTNRTNSKMCMRVYMTRESFPKNSNCEWRKKRQEEKPLHSNVVPSQTSFKTNIHLIDSTFDSVNIILWLRDVRVLRLYWDSSETSVSEKSRRRNKKFQEIMLDAFLSLSLLFSFSSVSIYSILTSRCKSIVTFERTFARIQHIHNMHVAQTHNRNKSINQFWST